MRAEPSEIVFLIVYYLLRGVAVAFFMFAFWYTVKHAVLWALEEHEENKKGPK